MKKKKLTVWTLPEELVIPFLAAVRMMERTVNPAFDFLLRCNACKQIMVKPVRSVKDKNSIIGFQCGIEDCGQTIKFGRKMNFKAPDFPTRLYGVPESGLIEPEGIWAKVKPDPNWVDDAFKILMEEGDE